MAVPDYQSVMLPLLQLAARKGTEISTSEAVDALAAELGLSEGDLKDMLPSGIQSTFVDRVGWASTYMKKAGLLEATRRGFYQITDRGRDLLKKQPKNINVKLLRQYPEFLEFQRLKGTISGDKVIEPKGSSEISPATPSEALVLE
jgi:restriction system protein